jgi:hypothetical protein
LFASPDARTGFVITNRILGGRDIFPKSGAFVAVAGNKMAYTAKSGVEKSGSVSSSFQNEAVRVCQPGRRAPAVEKSVKGARKWLISNKNGGKKVADRRVE